MPDRNNRYGSIYSVLYESVLEEIEQCIIELFTLLILNDIATNCQLTDMPKLRYN